MTYDPTRAAGRIPANVERDINLYQSSNFLGGGDLVPGGGFHGHYASYNLKDRPTSSISIWTSSTASRNC